MNIKTTFSTLVAIFLYNTIVCQIVITDSVGSVDLKNSGTLFNNSNLTHYTFFVKEPPKLEKNKTMGILTFYGQDLSEIKKETFALNKSNQFLEVKSNGKQLIVCSYNGEKRSISFKVFSSEGEPINVKELVYPKLLFYPDLYQLNEQIGEWALIYPIKNKGFLISEIVKKKRYGYNFHFISDNKNKDWTYQSPETHNQKKTASLLYSNPEIIVLLEKEWDSVYDKKPIFKAIVLDVTTGKELFTVSHPYKTKPNFYTKALATKSGEILLFGEQYEMGNSYPDNDYNSGYFIEKYSKSGQLKAYSILSFQNEKFKELVGFDSLMNRKEFGTIYFHEILESKGRYFAIGEFAKRERQGMTAARAVTSFAVGGALGGLIQGDGSTKYTLGSMFILELNQNCNLVNTNKLLKEKSLASLNTMVTRPYFNIHALKYLGKLDYIFHAESEASEFGNLFYLNQAQFEKKIDYTIRKARLENDSFLVTDFSKIQLSENERSFRVLARDSTSLLLVKFDSEKKSIKMEVLNQN
jgi:hypothetical protein